MAMVMSLKCNKDSIGTGTIGERKYLDICEVSSDEGKEMKEAEMEEGEGEKGQYELVMAVGHVKESWMEVPGNLVAHIKVGPSYHLRKEVGFHGY